MRKEYIQAHMYARTHKHTHTHNPGFTNYITSQIMECEHSYVLNNLLYPCKTQATSKVHISRVSGCQGNSILHAVA